MSYDELHAQVTEISELVSARLGDAPNKRCRELLTKADELIAASVTGTIDPSRALLIAATVILEAAERLEKTEPA